MSEKTRIAIHALKELSKPKYDNNHKGRACPACLARMALLEIERLEEHEAKENEVSRNI